MLAQEIIAKKRDAQHLSESELRYFFDAYQNAQIADYQMSALLMCFVLRGASTDETTLLTRLYQQSGISFDWGSDKYRVVDKHSTGGVGDKTSLILLPLAVLEGCLVPMMSGRGLGHTGGTVDKMESIPGTKVRFDAETARNLVKKLGGAFLGQSSDLAPLDQKIYALRDVTATVESIPLITASILSKKLAEGLQALVLDVKFGNGAFMQKEEDSIALATSLTKTAKFCGLSAVALRTNMNQVLGETAGHHTELYESFEILKGNIKNDCAELSVILASHMIKNVFPNRNLEDIQTACWKHLSNGSAWECFKKIVIAQGGDPTFIDQKSENLLQSPFIGEILYEHSESHTSYLQSIDVKKLGYCLIELGGGRRLQSDVIDYAAGLSSVAKIGSSLSKGQLICRVHAKSKESFEKTKQKLLSCFTFSNNQPKAEILLKEIIRP